MASSVQSSLEQAASAMGVEISDTPNFESDAQPQESQQQEVNEVQESVQESVQEPVQEDIEQPVAETESSLTNEVDEDVDIDSLMLQYYNEKFGVEHNSWEDIQSSTPQTEPNELPEAIKVIADFVEQTGRSPEDWFRYQQLNPSEMDDMTVVRISLAQQNPDLNQSELDLLISRKYKLDENRFDNDEIEYSKLQLKLDAKTARQEIDNVRNGFKLPAQTETAQEVQSPIDDNWISSMSNTVDNIEGLTFELGGGDEFTFTLGENYKSQLKDKNTRLDEFFDPYVNDQGDWNHELLSSHRAVIDNIENIVRAAYQYGLGKGQKKIVERAANIDASSPNQQSRGETNQVEKQIMDALFKGGDSLMRFK